MLTLVPLAHLTSLHKINNVPLHPEPIKHALQSLSTGSLARMTSNRGLMHGFDYLLFNLLTIPRVQSPFIPEYPLVEPEVRILWFRVKYQLTQQVLAMLIPKVTVL